MFNRQFLSKDEQDNLLERSETQFLDFKASSSNKAVFKTLSSFANADGGDLYVGIGDAREADRLRTAYENEEAANGLVSEALKMFHDGPEFLSGQFLQLENARLCLWFTVQKTPFVVKTPDGSVYKRYNAQDRAVRAEELSRLELDKGIISAEDRRTTLTSGDINNSSILESFVENLVPSMDILGFLRRERLLKDDYVSLAGAALFSDYPQPELPHASVKIYRYKSSSSEGDREDLVGQPETIEGPIYEQIRNSVNRTKEIIETIPVLSTAGLREIRYPPEAIHEVICNAVLHRDYSINDYVHIRIFDNRVEVESPGQLAGHVTLKNILKQRFARNKKMVRLIAKFPNPPNKDVGEGLNTTFTAMRSLNLKQPEISEVEAAVLVRLAHEPLASREEIIRGYLQKHGTINNTKAREVCNIQSDSIIRKMLAAMISAGEIEKVPNSRARGTKYQLKQ